MINSLIKRINLIDIRVKENELRLELYATLIPLLLSKEIFKNNKEIGNFTDKLILSKTLRDYVFRSRTQIVARLSREIEQYTKKEMSHTVKVMKEIVTDTNLIDTYNTKNNKKTNKIINTINKYSRNKVEKREGNHD